MSDGSFAGLQCAREEGDPVVILHEYIHSYEYIYILFGLQQAYKLRKDTFTTMPLGM